ncbi:MAG: TlyA family RNA methyltransferase [Chloroflexota bacterium]|nr:MAG: TlyA family RNA methyltransferase [Chloroflexota bacterium]
MANATRERLDKALVDRGLAPSREKAQALIMAGDVRVGGEVARRASLPIGPDAAIAVREPPPFVSRGGQKLAHALDAFGIDPRGLVCADVGASTGGFTDCLLSRGAKRVYAIDVGRGQLHETLRQDPRVIGRERTNARYLASLDESVQGATIDVSFISLRTILPAVVRWFETDGWLIALVKPQFEAGRADVGRGGVVRDPAIHRRVLREVADAVEALGWRVTGATCSPLTGPAGNREFLTLITRDGSPIDPTVAVDVE